MARAIYDENSIFNNVLFDRPGKLASGLFFWATGNLSCSVGAFQSKTTGKARSPVPWPKQPNNLNRRA